jgi:tyrosine-protein kinase Etk/Wzc
VSQTRNDGAGSDLLRLFYRITNYWLLFLICTVLALAVAFAYVRYTEKVYKISTTILLRDNASKDSGMEMLFKDLGIGGGKKNLENEIEILRSYAISKKAIDRLDFNVFYFAEGNIRTTEIYLANPFEVIIDSIPEEFAGTALYIKKVGNNEYQLHDQYEKNFFDPQTHRFSLTKSKSLPSRANLRFGISYVLGDTRFRIDYHPEIMKEYNEVTLFFFILNESDRLAGQYQSRLQVKQINKLSTILDLSLSGKNVQKEADFLNTLIQVYSENLLEEKNKVASNTIQFIDNQLTEITVSLQDAEEQLKYFRTNNKIMDLSFAATKAFNKLDALESEKAQIVVKRKYFDYLLNYIRTNDVLKEVVAPSAIGIDDPLLTSLIQQLSKLISERSVLALTAKEKNPAWFVLDDKINSVKKELVENLKSIIASSQITQDDINKRIQALEKSVDQLPDNERQLVNIQRKFNLNDNIYTYLLQKRAEAGISRAANIPDCQVVEEASVRSANLVAPKKIIVFAIALFLGLMAPLTVTLARIWMNDKILSKEDLENESNIPIVGMVGNSENFGNLVTHNNPRGAVTEDFRSIKLNLPYLQTRKDIQVLCVTSSVPGEGKTFCSVNLASVYAMSGKRTLVLFADLRRPRIDKELEVNTDFGLSNVLIGKSVLADVIQESSVKNLYVLTSGPTPPNPAELLGDRKMDEVMEELKKTFDCIIIDTPPLGLVADSLLMLKYCDVTCYIVRHNYTRKLFLRKINEMFEEKRIHNICLIINDIAGDTVGYGYGYGYRYGGYGYHHYGYFEDEGTTIWKKLIKAISGRFFKK